MPPPRQRTAVLSSAAANPGHVCCVPPASSLAPRFLSAGPLSVDSYHYYRAVLLRYTVLGTCIELRDQVVQVPAALSPCRTAQNDHQAEDEGAGG